MGRLSLEAAERLGAGQKVVSGAIGPPQGDDQDLEHHGDVGAAHCVGDGGGKDTLAQVTRVEMRRPE